LLFGLLVLWVFASAGAQAEGPNYRGTAEDQQACTDDVFRVCAQFVPDERKIVSCLIANRKKLSPGCHAVFARKPRFHHH
jgi:hypothetical protein